MRYIFIKLFLRVFFLWFLLGGLILDVQAASQQNSIHLDEVLGDWIKESGYEADAISFDLGEDGGCVFRSYLDGDFYQIAECRLEGKDLILSPLGGKKEIYKNITLRKENLAFVKGEVLGEKLCFYYQGKEAKFVRGYYGLKFKELRKFMLALPQKTGLSFENLKVTSFAWNTKESETRITGYNTFAIVEDRFVDKVKTYMLENGFKADERNVFKNTYGYFKGETSCLVTVSKSPEIKENQVYINVDCGIMGF